jgi:L-histidine Nalpha-methyltransferase
MIAPSDVHADAHQENSEAALEVASGLTARTKTLPPWLFYDEEGTALFEEITRLPEYYLTRTELGIFERSAREMAAAVSTTRHVVELGAGAATKTKVLLRALAPQARDLAYWPVDVSPAALRLCEHTLGRELPSVPVRPIHARYEDGLAKLGELDAKKLVLFIGSSIGNHPPQETARLLTQVRDFLNDDDALLLGTDMVKSAELLLPAYDDAHGVTARFNLNALKRINRSLGGTFDPRRFRHRAVWNAAASAIEMHLESMITQRVRVAALDLDVPFTAGETIRTESSTKYTDRRVAVMLRAAGLSLARSWYDDARWFGVHLVRRA